MLRFEIDQSGYRPPSKERFRQSSMWIYAFLFGSLMVDAQLQEIISLWHKIPGEARGSAYVMIKGMLIAAQQLPQK